MKGHVGTMYSRNRTIQGLLASLRTSIAVIMAVAIAAAGLVLLSAPGAGAASTTTYFTFGTPILGGWIQQAVITTGTSPATAPQGSNFTVAITPASQSIPASVSIATVNYLSGLTTIVPVPAGATFVSSSASGTGSYTGGPASNPSGTFTMTATYCTANNGTTCTATAENLTASSSASSAPYPFAGVTTTPYIEISTGTAQLPGGATVTFPTIDTTLTASGAVGTALNAQISEFDTSVNVTIASLGTYGVSVSGWPTGTTALPAASLTSSSPIPPAVPVTLTSTTITAPPATAPGAPTIGTATAGNA